MGKLLKYELRKLFGSKLIYVITGIFVAVSVLYAVSIYPDNGNMTLSALVDWLLYGFFLFYVLFIGAWIAPSFISPDYSHGGMLPNVVSRGFSRVEVFIAKYISLIFLHVFAFFVSFIIGFVLGLPFVEDASSPIMTDKMINLTLNMLLSCFAALSIQVLISVACKKKAAVLFSMLSTNPILAFMVYLLPALMNKKAILDLSGFIQDWYAPFAYMKIILARATDSIGMSVIKIDFGHLVLSSIILFALSFGGSILIVSRKEISK